MAVPEEAPSTPGSHANSRSPTGFSTSLGLLERARANDAEAWRRLVHLYRPLVLYWCMKGGANGTDAEDLSQEVFTAASQCLSRFHRDQPGDTFRGWLRGIVRNQLLMYFRRTAREPRGQGGSDFWQKMQQVVDPLPTCEAEEAVEISRLYQRAVELVRGDFAEQTWQAFSRTVIDGRAPATLTDELGMSTANIRQAKSRVLRRLKEELGDLLE
jgi:RNA polymerase sigma-70 factor, ECF subfamily